MNYYEIFDLKEEPFSNSPDPKFFYNAPGHVQCLRRLEIAIRLLRGLNVVLGEVGMGKTTLCRLLIRQLAQDPNIDVHLLLDPYFTTSVELLAVLHRMIVGRPPEPEDTAWALKDAVKNELYRLGVERKKIVVLIIDEGQKMRPEHLELLREFLNYETNDRKLLQIILFGQLEFADRLKEMPNLSDRINEIHTLKPLSFSQTKALIQHRLELARAGAKSPNLFTFGGFWTVHRETGGRPRRIMNLCHKSFLALVLRNGKRIDRAVVKACSRDQPLGAARSGLRFALASTLLVVLALGWWSKNTVMEAFDKTRAALVQSVAPSPSAQTTSHAVLPADQTDSASPRPDLSEKKAESPAIDRVGETTLAAGDSLNELLLLVYGEIKPELRSLVALANPSSRLEDKLPIERRIALPALPPAKADGREDVLVVLADKTGLDDAVQAASSAHALKPGLRVLCVREPGEQARCLVVHGRPWRGERDAYRAALVLSPAQREQVRFVSGFAPGAVFTTPYPEAPFSHDAVKKSPLFPQ